MTRFLNQNCNDGMGGVPWRGRAEVWHVLFVGAKFKSLVDTW